MYISQKILLTDMATTITEKISIYQQKKFTSFTILLPTKTFFDLIVVCLGREIDFNYDLDRAVDMFHNFCQWLYPLFFHIQDASGPFLYGTLNRRPQMTLPRPRSDRLGSEGSSIMNGLHHHHPLIMTSASGDPQLTNSISAYNNQDVWTPIQTHRYYSCLCLQSTFQDSPKLISRKIWMLDKAWNFPTVGPKSQRAKKN